MRAAVCPTYGPPEVVRIREVAQPAPTDDEILICVRATTVNRTDCAVRGARPFFMRLFTGLRRPRARILGNEFAGEVEAVGRAVTAFQPGDRVFGYNEGPFGAHAEYMTVPSGGSVAHIPDGVEFTAAAAGTEGAHYALSYIEAAKIGPRHDVMVYGATGAIGSAAVQLLKSRGATVTAVCATQHLDLVRGLGADRVMDYTAEDFTKDRQQYDLVFDAVGKSSFRRCWPLLRPGGIYGSTDLGPFPQINPLLALVTPLLGRFLKGRKVVFPIPKHDQAMVRAFARLMETGDFKPVIDRTYALDQVVEAYQYVERGQKVGNVVIEVS